MYFKEALHGGNGWTLAALAPLDSRGVRGSGLGVGASGCATTAGAPAADANAGLITPSDEPETRRRARIRLELASNYFENGQTAVALDEVKQALATDANYADAFNLRVSSTCVWVISRRRMRVSAEHWHCVAVIPICCTTMVGYSVSKENLAKRISNSGGHLPILHTPRAAKP